MAKPHCVRAGAKGARATALTAPGDDWSAWGDEAPEPRVAPEWAAANGFKTAEEYARRAGICHVQASHKCTEKFREGRYERVVLTSRAYAYRPKQ